MTLCPLCGLELSGVSVEVGACCHHALAHGDEWATTNRIMCDWLHRHIEPARVPETARVESYEGVM